jgi:hypothetical protein
VLTFVVIFNLLITLLNLWIIWKIFQMRQVLRKITETLAHIEQRVHSVLYPAPELILRGQTGTYYLRKRYLVLEQQLQQLSNIFSLLRLGFQFWQWQSRSKVTKP